jgi:hypothetical protein
MALNLAITIKFTSQLKKTTCTPYSLKNLAAGFLFSNYLFNRLPEYNILPVGEDIYIEDMPLRGTSSKPLFDDWVPKVYGQVLENFWKNWGFLLLEIIKNPENP